MVHPVHPVHPTMIHHGYHWVPDGTSTAVDHTTSLVLRTFALRSLAKRRFGVHSVHIGDWSHPMTPPLTILTSCGDQVRSSGKWQLIISPAINSLGLTQGLTPPKFFSPTAECFGVFSLSKGFGADRSSSKTDSPKVPRFQVQVPK